MELHNKYVTIDRHFVSLTAMLWGKEKPSECQAPFFLIKFTFRKKGSASSPYTSIQEFNIIFCTAHCIASNKPIATQCAPVISTFHHEDQLPHSGNIHHIQPLFSRSQPIDDAVRPQHYRVRPTDDARIKGHLKKRERERELKGRGGLHSISA